MDGSSSQVIVEREGRKYLVDLVSREIKEFGTTVAVEETGVSSSKAEPNNSTQSSKTQSGAPPAVPPTYNKSTHRIGASMALSQALGDVHDLTEKFNRPASAPMSGALEYEMQPRDQDDPC